MIKLISTISQKMEWVKKKETLRAPCKPSLEVVCSVHRKRTLCLKLVGTRDEDKTVPLALYDRLSCRSFSRMSVSIFSPCLDYRNALH